MGSSTLKGPKFSWSDAAVTAKTTDEKVRVQIDTDYCIMMSSIGGHAFFRKKMLEFYSLFTLSILIIVWCINIGDGMCMYEGDQLTEGMNFKQQVVKKACRLWFLTVGIVRFLLRTKLSKLKIFA